MTVPNWKAERYLLGELPASEMDALKALENENGKFCMLLKELRNSNEELLKKHPPKQFKIIEKMPKYNHKLYMATCAAILICATCFLVLFSSEYMPSQNVIVVSEDTTRIKGLKTDLEIWRKTVDSTEKLMNNSEAQAGDLLQMQYIVEKKCYGVILSMDGNGVLTIHLAGKNGKAAELEAGRISLSSAYELDNAPKHETFYLFTANNEFELSIIAEKLLQGKLPKDLQVAQITLKKK